MIAYRLESRLEKTKAPQNAGSTRVRTFFQVDYFENRPSTVKTTDTYPKNLSSSIFFHSLEP